MNRNRIQALYLRHFRDARRERLFLASLSFFVTFGVTRLLTHSWRMSENAFPGLIVSGTHVHHLVWGIALLLLVGYGWLIQMGNGADPPSLASGRVLATLYGTGAALTLDEFALWLNLEDVYWEEEGRASIDAVMLFGALVSAGIWAGPFLRALGRHWRSLLRRLGAGPRPG